ncbi:MAG: DNA-deoxyinosine glycosylase [Gammaproteobacteria bacterium]
MTRITGFAPLVGQNSRVLILGSMPSVASLEKHQYYGKPQNAFWKIMGELIAAGPELDYEIRAEKLIGQNIAVWDVLASCVRPGSLDSAIEISTAEVNDFRSFFDCHPGIHSVFFNGRKAEEVFNKKVLKKSAAPDHLIYECLPSTSPAMATLSFAEKLKHWRAVSKALDNK